MIKN
jgi:hypothetical protein